MSAPKLEKFIDFLDKIFGWMLPKPKVHVPKGYWVNPKTKFVEPKPK